MIVEKLIPFSNLAIIHLQCHSLRYTTQYTDPVKNMFISQGIIAHTDAHWHIVGYGCTHSILTFVLQLKFDHTSFQLNHGFGRQTNARLVY